MKALVSAVLSLLLAFSAVAQTPTYQPKFQGDKARSNAEAAALGYIRTVANAQKVYKKKRGQYAKSLDALVGSGSFTRRMTTPDRGDYNVGFTTKSDGYSLTLTPKLFDAEHRAFFADETGTIRAEDTKAATKSSPPLD